MMIQALPLVDIVKKGKGNQPFQYNCTATVHSSFKLQYSITGPNMENSHVQGLIEAGSCFSANLPGKAPYTISLGRSGTVADSGSDPGLRVIVTKNDAIVTFGYIGGHGPIVVVTTS